MNLIERVKNIISRPKFEWDIIDSEPTDISKIMTTYVLPLAGAAALAAFIGYAFVGVNIRNVQIKGIDRGLYEGLTVLITAFLSVFVSALVIDALAPSFGSQKNLPESVQLTAYSYTPFWVGGLLAIFPPLAFLGSLFGIYGLYLLYLGLGRVKKPPRDKQVAYFVVSLLAILVVYVLIGWILGMLMMNVFGLNSGNYDNFGGY